MKDGLLITLIIAGVALSGIAAVAVYERKFKKDPFCAAAPILVALGGFSVFPCLNLMVALFALLYAFDDLIEKRE